MKATTADSNKRLLEVAHGRYSFTPLLHYDNTNQQVWCKCNTCGHEWHTRYGNLVNRGDGCRKCGARASTLIRKLHIDEVISRLEVASSQRGYSFKLPHAYIRNSQLIECICSTCGHTWSASFASLTSQMTGCPQCAGHMRLSTEQANARLSQCASQQDFTFTRLNSFTGVRQKVRCTCNKCKRSWVASYSNLVYMGQGCPYACKGVKISESKRRTSTADANYTLQQVGAGRYTHTPITKYINGRQIITCTCNSCRTTFINSYDNLVRLGQGCPNRCYITPQYISTSEHEIVDYIKRNFPQLEIQQSVRSLIKNPTGNSGLELDIYIPELQLAFEFNGSYWHSDPVIQKTRGGYFRSASQYHTYKTHQCLELDIYLLHIDEAQYRVNKCGVLSFVYWVVSLRGRR